MSHDARLILSVVGAVILLIVLIARAKMNSFVALVIASLAAGLFAGMNLPDIAKAFGEGVGSVLGSVAMVIGLGAILGKMLGESAGAEVIAVTITNVFGDKRLPWAIVVIALIVGLPVFFPVGVVLLTPIVIAIARRSGVNFLTVALPMVAGLSAAHGLIPPHPGPMVAIETLHADAGKTILYSLILAVPAAILAGPIYARWIAPRMPDVATPVAVSASNTTSNRPSFAVTVFTVSLPVLLMLVSTVADLLLPKTNQLRLAANFIGSPICALTLSVIVSFFTFGVARGFTSQQILKFSEECLGPTAAALLIVGAGGGFNRILVVSGVGDVISKAANNLQLSPLVLGWLVAVLIRIATG